MVLRKAFLTMNKYAEMARPEFVIRLAISIDEVNLEIIRSNPTQKKPGNSINYHAI